MKKKNAILFSTVILICLCLGQTAFGVERFGIGANISYMGIADTGPNDTIEFDGVTMIGLNATAQFNSFMSLALDMGYSKFDVDRDSASSTTIKTGELEQIPLLLTARIHLPILKSINPYLGAGIGYYFNDFDTSDFQILTSGKLSADDNFAFHLNAGIEFFFGDHLALNVDLKYLWNEVDLSDPAAILDDSLDMRTFIGGVGVKFYF